MFDNVTNGEHTLTVTATDTEGNVSTKTVNFSKEPPYTPRFAGEILYMPFDGDFMDLVDIGTPTEIGSPGFAEESYLGTGAYLGAPDSYLTLPLDDDLTEEFSAAFWYKPSGNPDRAGILVAGDDEVDRNQGFRLFREGNADEGANGRMGAYRFYSFSNGNRDLYQRSSCEYRYHEFSNRLDRR